MGSRTLGLMFAASIAAIVTAQQPFSAAPPTLVADLQGARLKGDPSELAWSPDGSRVVYIQQQGRHHYALMQVSVTHPAAREF